MKTLKSIQKNREQLNSLLMEKWGYKKLNEDEEPSKEEEKEKTHTKVTTTPMDAKKIAKKMADETNKSTKSVVDDEGRQLEEAHDHPGSCKKAHAGMTHEEWETEEAKEKEKEEK